MMSKHIKYYWAWCHICCESWCGRKHTWLLHSGLCRHWLLKMFVNISFIYMVVLPAFVPIFITCMQYSRRTLDSLGLGLQTVLGYHVGASNQTLLPWKSSQVPLPAGLPLHPLQSLSHNIAQPSSADMWWYHMEASWIQMPWLWEV